MAKSPKPPNAGALAAQQATFNKTAGQQQQETNMVNQTTPFGSLQYSQTGTNPDGTPIFAANQSFSPQVQGAYDSIFGKINSNAGQDLTGTQMGLYSKYMQPLIDQQRNKLEGKLYNQGLQPGVGDGRAYN